MELMGFEGSHCLLKNSVSVGPTASQTVRLAGVFFAIAIILPLLLHLHLDYLAFVALGPGGTPSTVQGFMRVKLLSFFALKHPYEPIAHQDTDHVKSLLRLSCRSRDETSSNDTTLSDLPVRPGFRPETRGIAPQRQITQKAPPAIRDRLIASVRSLAAARNDIFVARSCIEPHSMGLFVKSASTQPVTATEERRQRCNEIAHLHAFDGSSHVKLRRDDAAAVLRKQWGEWHPLASGGWLERFVPENFVLLYAPREESEVEVITRIVEAAATGAIPLAQGM